MDNRENLVWVDKSRRLCGNDEELPENHERVVYIVMVGPMLRRLTDNQHGGFNQQV